MMNAGQKMTRTGFVATVHVSGGWIQVIHHFTVLMCVSVKIVKNHYMRAS